MTDQETTMLKAFVLMPFDPEFDAIFNDLIKPTLEEVGYTVTRADSILNQQNILKDIVRGIAEADIVIADLTSLNANVFYEIGIAHTLQIPTVLLSQSSEDIPFDLKPYRVITYSTHFIGAPQLSQKLKEIGEKAKHGDLGFGNPIVDFLPQRNRIISPTTTENKTALVVGTQASDENEEEEKEILDFIVDTEKTIHELNECMDEISNATLVVTESFIRGTAELQEIKNIKSPGSAMRVHRIATDVATNMIKFAQMVEDGQPKFHNAWEALDENTSGIIKFARITSKEDKDGAIGFRSTLERMQLEIQSSLHAIQKYKDTAISLKGISRDINRASKRTTHILDLLMSELEGADSFCAKSITLLDEKIAADGKNI